MDGGILAIGFYPQSRPAQRKFGFAGDLDCFPPDNSFFYPREEKSVHGRVVGAENILFAVIQFRFAVQRGKELRKLPHGLGSSQEEETTRVQRIVEKGGFLITSCSEKTSMSRMPL